MATKDPLHSQPVPNLGDRPPALKPEQIVALHEIVQEKYFTFDFSCTNLFSIKISAPFLPRLMLNR
jgi:hypothetical protein